MPPQITLDLSAIIQAVSVCILGFCAKTLFGFVREVRERLLRIELLLGLDPRVPNGGRVGVMVQEQNECSEHHRDKRPDRHERTD